VLVSDEDAGAGDKKKVFTSLLSSGEGFGGRGMGEGSMALSSTTSLAGVGGDAPTTSSMTYGGI
jgi:hypothetical protein